VWRVSVPFFFLKVRVLEGVEQVYVHYKGGKKEDDEWVELTVRRSVSVLGTRLALLALLHNA
jgi:hypothetical protein